MSYLFQKFHICVKKRLYLPTWNMSKVSYLFQNFQVPIPQKTQKPKMATIYQEMPKTLSQPCLVLRQQDHTAKISSNRKVRNIAKWSKNGGKMWFWQGQKLQALAFMLHVIWKKAKWSLNTLAKSSEAIWQIFEKRNMRLKIVEFTCSVWMTIGN